MPTLQRSARPARTNRFAAPCARCNNVVPEGTGSLTREGDRWVVRHLAACPPPRVLAEAPRPEAPSVPAGHYAVRSLTGNNDLDFFRVDRPDEGRWAGYTFVKRVIGGRPDTAVRGATARAALAAIAQDPDKAALAYGLELGRCFVCNRSLTDETSRALGIGPDCRGRR